MASDSSKRRPFKWRRWNNVLHRDLGYLCVALTIVYAISGIAVICTSRANGTPTIAPATSPRMIHVNPVSVPPGCAPTCTRAC